ncbi:hypothetical protein SAMN02745121_07281 [Nannocystis exedens]|uniref:Uncharacterized protein n=1 Tax=Nannocystis exedens TaxID=54 RepID=A0A1I2GHV7_9BACT|nr:hypothetical protein NAEX_02970 [Nannocystis exedens]SFF16447.1 hypothetical protein SAMN02745121_07281 [Nannocystis exedens]
MSLAPAARARGFESRLLEWPCFSSRLAVATISPVTFGARLGVNELPGLRALIVALGGGGQ